MRAIHPIFFCAVLITFFVHFEANSQTNESKIKNLSEKADIILTGKVIKQNSSWNQEGSRIYTDVTVQTDEYLKGEYIEKNITLKTPGGEVGDVGELYSHMPQFKNNEDVLLFVKKDQKDMNFKVLNGEEGKITLYNDNKTGEKVTSFNKKVSSLKKEIKNYVEKQQ